MEEEKKDADETSNSKPVEVKNKPPAKVPTLYVRNLNDKVKVEGKYLLQQRSFSALLAYTYP